MMGLFNFGIGKEERDRSHLKNLITVALADGKIKFSEARILIKTAKKLGLDVKDVIAIKNNLKSVKFAPPKHHSERLFQARELVGMMMASSYITSDEIEACKKMALKLNLLPKVIDDIIDYLSGKDQPQIAMIFEEQQLRRLG